MSKRFRPEADVEFVPIPLDRESRELLKHFAGVVGKPPITVAAELLHDLLREDLEAHPGERPPGVLVH